MADQSTVSKASNKALIGAGLAVAVGAAGFLLARRSPDVRDDGNNISDAPDHTWRRKTGRYKEGLVGRTVSIDKPREEIFAAWRDFTRFRNFMENVERVEDLGDGRSRWTIKAPLGSTVELVTRIGEEIPNDLIAWKSEPDSQIQTQGRVQLFEVAPGRGTAVRLTMTYDPPAGLPGRAIAKILQREPNVQARRDLRRFKQLIETGEVATNAGPSGRGEPVNQPKI
jgi:uncharacterized membrane protein